MSLCTRIFFVFLSLSLFAQSNRPDFDWVKTAGQVAGQTNGLISSDMARAPNGTLFVTGYFNGSVDFGDQINLGTTAPRSAFVSAYDGEGTTLWAVAIGESGYSGGLSVKRSIPSRWPWTGMGISILSADLKVPCGLGPTPSSDFGSLNLVVPANTSSVFLGRLSPAFYLTPEGNLATDEVGNTGSFTMRMHQQPAGDVRVTLFSSDPSEGVVSPSEVIFTASNWAQPQAVLVTGVDDLAGDGSTHYQIGFQPTYSLDPKFNGIVLDPVSVVNHDDDHPNFSWVTSIGQVPGQTNGVMSSDVIRSPDGTLFITGYF